MVFVISKIINVEICVISQGPQAEADNITETLIMLVIKKNLMK